MKCKTDLKHKIGKQENFFIFQSKTLHSSKCIQIKMLNYFMFDMMHIKFYKKECFLLALTFLYFLI